MPMPYKGRVKQGQERKRKKPGYRIANWTEYNLSLRKRGMISLYFPDGDLKTQFINTKPYVKGVSGRASVYQEGYIELIYTFYRLHGRGMRQITGFMEDVWARHGLDIPVPSFGHLSDRFARLNVDVKQRSGRLAKRLANGDAIDILLDSSGMRFGRASQWYKVKYGEKTNRTPWRKMHLSIDPDMNMHEIAITDTEVSDGAGMDLVMPAKTSIAKVIADGAHYSIERGETLFTAGVLPVIPPPAHAVVHGQDNTTWHDQIVQYIKDKGSVYAFHKKYGYGARSLVEAQISRIKRCIGSALLTQKTDSQQREGVIIANLINLWNAFGRPVSVKTA